MVRQQNDSVNGKRPSDLAFAKIAAKDCADSGISKNRRSAVSDEREEESSSFNAPSPIFCHVASCWVGLAHHYHSAKGRWAQPTLQTVEWAWPTIITAPRK